jgi:hypothetical protein
MESEAYFTIHEWRGIPEGREIEAQINEANGDVVVTDPKSGTLLHSCMKELIAAVRLDILVDVKIAKDEEKS